MVGAFFGRHDKETQDASAANPRWYKYSSLSMTGRGEDFWLRYRRFSLHGGPGRTVGPIIDRQQKYRQPLRRVLGCQERRGRQVCAPGFGIGCGSEEHQVRVPVAIAIAQVALFRHHVAHCAGFGRGQLVVVECGVELGAETWGFESPANTHSVFFTKCGR